MKKISLVMALMLAAYLMIGCAGLATMNHSPSTGVLYTDVKAPLPHASVAMDANSAAKIGTATTNSILGWIATGDASVEAAMKNGGITKVHHVDFHSTHILGLFATYTVTVYGE